MTLSHSQIAGLYKFTEKHYVEHYDVQVEVVDHLVSAIEAKLEIDTGLSFEDALSKVY